MRTVTVGIAIFPGLYEIPWGTIFAASTIVIIPLVILVLIFQREQTCREQACLFPANLIFRVIRVFRGFLFP